jgi:hypothetical protein
VGSIWLREISSSSASLNPGVHGWLLASLVNKKAHLGYELLDRHLSLVKLLLQLLVLTLLLGVLVHESLLLAILVVDSAGSLLLDLLGIVSGQVGGVSLVGGQLLTEGIFVGEDLSLVTVQLLFQGDDLTFHLLVQI